MPLHWPSRFVPFSSNLQFFVMTPHCTTCLCLSWNAMAFPFVSGCNKHHLARARYTSCWIVVHMPLLRTCWGRELRGLPCSWGISRPAPVLAPSCRRRISSWLDTTATPAWLTASRQSRHSCNSQHNNKCTVANCSGPSKSIFLVLRRAPHISGSWKFVTYYAVSFPLN